MTREVRYVVSLLVSPALVGTLISIWAIATAADHIRSQVTVLVPVYFFFTYVVAIIPAATGFAILYFRGYRGFWQFVVAGSVVGFVSAFFAITLLSPAAFWVLAAMGPAIGGTAWLMCEWHPVGVGAE